jgi:ankyrin repeat protein
MPKTLSQKIKNALVMRNPVVSKESLKNTLLDIPLADINQDIILEDYDLSIDSPAVRHPLLLAIEKNLDDVARHLIEKGADVNKIIEEGQDEGLTALWRAATKHDEKMVELLIKKGADVKYMPTEGNFTAMNAIAVNLLSNDIRIFAEKETSHRENICKLLIENGTDVAADISTGYYAKTNILCEAIKSDFTELVKLLIEEKDFNVNTKDGLGRTAIMEAARNHNNIELVNLLIQRGASINAVDNDGNTALTESVHHNNVEIFKLLLQNGADLKSCGIEVQGRMLRDAALNSNRFLLDWLIKNNVDINATDNDGQTALTKAVYNNDVEIFNLLIQNGADLKSCGIETQGRMLRSAAVNGNKAIVEWLVKNKVNINYVENETTAIMAAVYHANFEIAKFLFMNGAKIGNLENENWTLALDNASNHGANDCVAFIKNAAKAEPVEPLLYSKNRHKGPSKMVPVEIFKLAGEFLTGNEPVEQSKPKEPTKHQKPT